MYPRAKRRNYKWQYQEGVPPVFVRKSLSEQASRTSRPRRRLPLRPRLPKPGRSALKKFVLFTLAAAAGAAIWSYSETLGGPVLAAPAISSPVLSAGPVLPLLEKDSEFRVSHTVRSGETLSDLSRRYGLTVEVAQNIYKQISELRKKHDLKAFPGKGQKIELSLADTGELQQISSRLSAEHDLLISRSGADQFELALTKHPKKELERMVVGKIESSFAAAAQRAGLSYDVVDDLVDLFSHRVDFYRDIRKGDRFTLIFRDQILTDGTDAGAGPILAAAMEVGDRHLAAVRYVGTDGKARYFDEKGELIGNSFLRYPVKFSRISSHFNKSRFHPVLKKRRPHNGVDFAAPTGTPVRSVADGTIVYSGRKGGNGKMVKIRHTDRYSTAYLHLSKISKGIRKGAKVARGQTLGAVGMTGLATGPHLHYSFYDRGKYVDPLKIKLPAVEMLHKGTKIDKRYLKRVLFTLDHYQNVNLKKFYWG